MKSMEKTNQEICVEELAALNRMNGELYNALKFYCVNRGLVESRRLAKRVKSNAGVKGLILNQSLSSAQNRQLLVLVCRMVNSVETAVDMYELFRQCDNPCEEEELWEDLI